MVKVLLVLLTARFSPLAWALQAPDFTAQMNSETISAESPPGYHFNIKAPVALLKNDQNLKQKPITLNEKKIIFKRSDEDKTGSLKLSAFLCDDQLSFCEKHTIALASVSSALPLHDTNSSLTSAANRMNKSESPREENGFIVNLPDVALAQAAREDKPLLIDFYGIWCPPCNELDEEVFSTEKFKKGSNAFVKLKLDADSEVSWALKSKYKVGGYPTLIFATAHGDEITRVVGFRNNAQMSKVLIDAFDHRALSVESLTKKADGGDQVSADRLGLIYFELKDYDHAIHYLEKSKKNRETYLEVQIASQKDPKALIQAHENYLKEFSQSPDSLDVRAKLATLYADSNAPDKKSETLRALIQTARELEKHPRKLFDYDLAPADVYSTEADAQEELGDLKLSKAAWANAAREYEKKKLNERERGYNLELAYALNKSGQTQKASNIYEKLETHYPKEFTFFYAHASMLNELKNYALALPVAQKAWDFAYGDNKLRATKLLAQVMAGTGKKGEAKKLIGDILSSESLPKDESIRTHRYAQALKDLLEKL